MKKKFTALLTILLLSITASCRTTKIEDSEIILPPKPQREERPTPTNLEEVGELLAYYESLVQSWENWGERVETIVKN